MPLPGELLQVASRLVLGREFTVEQGAVLTSGVTTVVIDNLIGDGLRVEWDVEKTSNPDPDTAHLVIYNLNKPLRKQISALNNLPGRVLVQLQIGWAGITEVLFRGESWRMVPERRAGTDILTEIEAGDGMQPLDAGPSGGASYGVGFSALIALLAEQQGWRISLAAVAEIQAAGAALAVSQFQHVADYSPVEQINLIMASLRLSWGVTDGQFVVYRAGIRNDVVPALLTPQNGLLTWAELDDGGAEFEALTQPRTVPGQQISINDELGVPVGGGPLRVEHVTFSGSSEGPSLMRGVARKLQLF